MSLLNEMLKDLNESKGHGKAELSFITREDPAFFSKVSKYVPWVLAIFIVSLIVVLIVHAINLSRQKPDVVEMAISTSSRIASVAVADTRLSDLLIISRALAKATTNSLQQNMSLASLNPKQNPINLPTELLPSRLVPIPMLRVATNTSLEFEGGDVGVSGEPVQQAIMNKVFSALNGKELHDDLLDKALLAIEAGDDPEAIRLLEHLLTKFPTSIDARESLAALFLARSELSEAMNTLDEGIRLVPSSLILTAMKARLLIEQDNGREALRLLRRFNPDISVEPDFYGLMAAALQALGRAGEAGSLYKSLVEVEPSNGQYWLGYGIALEYKQAIQQAIAAYKHATQSYEVEPSVRAYAENRLKILQG